MISNSKSSRLKIGIVTFYRANNYGAQLQCYALVSILKNMGSIPIILDISDLKKKKSTYYLRKLIDNLLFYKTFVNFRKKNLSKVITSSKVIEKTKECDAVIVGSDQVWRLEYTRSCDLHYFLDFVPDDIMKISYAASFGVENFCSENTTLITIKKLLERFTYISVRESSGVSICKEVFNIKAELVLDPTLLLDADEYQSLMKSFDINKSIKRHYIAVFLLDPNNEKDKIINRFTKHYSEFVINQIGPKKSDPFLYKKFPSKIFDHIYPSFSSWLNGIKDAKFVITDSYHGLIFSIIFRKQFICIVNEKRGTTRMKSLLSLLALDDRLIDEKYDHLNVESLSPINYDRVENLIKVHKNVSINFLNNFLINVK